MNNLKPCPFCGGPAEIWRASVHLDRAAWIGCMGRCSVLVSREYKTDEEAIAAWNTRVPTPPALSAPNAGESEAEAVKGNIGAWHEGEPPKPFRTEWFIAETVHGDRVVLTALPGEWTYDYKTADDTYIMAKNIKRWMQFPDSQFIPYSPKPTPLPGIDRLEVVAWLNWSDTNDQWSLGFSKADDRPDHQALVTLAQASAFIAERDAEIERLNVGWDQTSKMLGAILRRAETAEARIKALEEAMNLALEHWAHRQQRYKNRHPVWVQKARAALSAGGRKDEA